MVGSRIGFHADQAAGLLCEERQQLTPRQPPLDNNRPASINAVYLKTDFPRSNPIVTVVSIALLHIANP
jgi:hypothetical protein